MFTARMRITGKVMFSQVSVCSQWEWSLSRGVSVWVSLSRWVLCPGGGVKETHTSMTEGSTHPTGMHSCQT